MSTDINKLTKAMRPSSRSVNRGLGFTLVEMVVTIAIMSVVVGTAVGSFVPMIDRSRINEAQNQLRTDIVFARGEAIKFGGWVQICGVSDYIDDGNYRCQDDLSEGWIVYRDDDKDYDFSSRVDTVLSVSGPMYDTLFIYAFDLSGNWSAELNFNHRGYPNKEIVYLLDQGDERYRFLLKTTGNIEIL